MHTSGSCRCGSSPDSGMPFVRPLPLPLLLSGPLLRALIVVLMPLSARTQAAAHQTHVLNAVQAMSIVDEHNRLRSMEQATNMQELVSKNC
ncbi:unnamed protein product [Soboliphyme baturini]|uniref:Secreted protein n=1 Tax=Soboliphyme baturini TaxID=241478 RepID=A0A183J1T4_9BILA|nr:unnamed protein product [Soboliphyme baturini]